MKEKKLINKKTLIVGIATVVILSGYLWYRSYNKNKTGSIAENDITTEKAVSGNIVSGISASGTIQTANYLAVTTSVNGIVSKVYVKEGDQVIKGQNIMEITLDSEGEKSKIKRFGFNHKNIKGVSLNP